MNKIFNFKGVKGNSLAMVKLKREFQDNNDFPGSTEIDECTKQTKNNYRAKYPCKANKSWSFSSINKSENKVMAYRLLYKTCL